MTTTKLIGNIQPLDEVDKINEIIDNKVEKSGDSMTGGLTINNNLTVNGVFNKTTPTPEGGYHHEFIMNGESPNDNANAKGVFIPIEEQPAGWHPVWTGGTAKVVTQSYVNGVAGYRIWSDGTIEQWGAGGTSTNPADVYFPTPFSSTNYVVVTNVTGVSASGVYSIRIDRTTGSYFTAKSSNHDGDVAGVGFLWYAIGY